MKEYLVIYEQGDDGTWGAYCPTQPAASRCAYAA